MLQKGDLEFCCDDSTEKSGMKAGFSVSTSQKNDCCDSYWVGMVLLGRGTCFLPKIALAAGRNLIVHLNDIQEDLWEDLSWKQNQRL